MRDVLQDNGFRLGAEACEVIARAAGQRLEVKTLDGGVVHHVARVEGERGTLILKHRGTTCWALPDRPLRPQDAAFEAEALRLFASTAPGLAPRLLCFDRPHATIIMTDLGASREREGIPFLTHASVEEVHAAVLDAAERLARLHRALAFTHPGAALRPDGDEEIFARNVFEHVGYHATPGTRHIAEALTRLDRGLTLGDFSPKNMRFEADGIRVFDLEHVHRGVAVFDLAFLLGHVLLHRATRDAATIGATIDKAIASYHAGNALSTESARLLGPLIGTAILYRTSNPVVPYDVPLTAPTRATLNAALLADIDTLTVAEVVALSHNPCRG